MANISNSILELEDYQNEAYNNVEGLFQDGRYAAVVLPTGTGKSFVTLKYIQEHPDKRVLFLSPRHAINNQMYEYIVRYIGGRTDSIESINKEFDNIASAAESFIPNVKALLYQAIMRIADNGKLDGVIEKLKPDLIVLDEVHHVKTKRVIEQYVVDDEDEVVLKRDDNIWGKTVKQLIDKCPNAKVLGLSATPIRTDGANVVERLFENSIAYEMTLLEAMEEGIIHPPRYVVPDFVKEDELETLLEKIDKAEGQRKIELKELYDKLTEMSSKAPGIPEVMGEHIKEKNGKYIVFCKDIKDMNEKMSQAKEWFGGIDNEPTIYRVSSANDDNKKQLDAFNNDNSDKLKLMYCVGMINEGVHINDVSGVILTTKTGSQIDFLQKIGRTITISNDTRETLVIDLANSNEVLSREFNDKQYEIDDLEALQGLVDWIEKHDGKYPDYENFRTNKEKIMFLRMKRLNNKYFKYVEDPTLLEMLNDDEREEYETIISLGESIDLFTEKIKVSNEEKIQERNEALNKFLEDIKIKGIRKEFIRILQESTIQRSAYDELIEWLEAHDGKMPQVMFRDKTTKKQKLANQLTDEEHKQKILYCRWKETKECKILKEYEGKDILEVPEEYREKIEKLRSFGLGIKQKNVYEELVEWLETHDGKMPNSYVRDEITRQVKKKTQLTEEERAEVLLYSRWKKSIERKVLNEYIGKDILEVPKEYREIIKKLRDFGLGIKQKTVYEEIVDWLETHNGKLPKSCIREDGKFKSPNQLTKEEREETNLYARWAYSKEYKILKEYAGKDILEVPEDYREKVEVLRSFGLGEKQKSTYEETIEWLETHDGKMPRSAIIDSVTRRLKKRRNQMTEEEKAEINLYRRIIYSEEYKILNEYAGKDISEVPEEYREKIAKLRSYGLGLELKSKKEKLKEAKEERDSAQELNEETKELEQQVKEVHNKKTKGRKK